MNRLTPQRLRSAEPRIRPYRLSDGESLALQVMPNGTKAWRFRYRIDRREKMISLGLYPAVPIEAARRLRDDARDSAARRILISEIEAPERQLAAAKKAHATSIPVSVTASNMCLAFPAEISTIESFCTHVSACAQGAHEKLYSDLGRVRQMALENPSDARAGVRYEKDYGPAVAGNGSWFQPPNVDGDEWLQVGPPNFAHARAGFHYETLQIRRDFNGPEKITLPNGNVVEIKPQNSSAPTN